MLGSGAYNNAAEVTAADQTDPNDTYGNGSGNDYDTQSTTPNAVADLSLTKTVDDTTPEAGTNRVVTVTGSNAAGFSSATNVVVNDLLPSPVTPGHLFVATDVGAAKMARGYAKRLGAGLAIMDKRRPEANQAEIMNVIGEVEGCDCVIVDDIIDTAGTLVNSAEALMDRGARSVYAAGVHPVFSGPAVGRIRSSRIEKVMVGRSE